MLESVAKNKGAGSDLAVSGTPNSATENAVFTKCIKAASLSILPEKTNSSSLAAPVLLKSENSDDSLITQNKRGGIGGGGDFDLDDIESADSEENTDDVSKEEASNVPATKPHSQEKTEKAVAVKSTESAAAFENFEEINAPEQSAGNSRIRFTLKDGKKYYVEQSVNPKMYQDVVTFYNARQILEQYPEHELKTSEDSLPDIHGFNSVDQLKEPQPGVLVYETNKGSKGIVLQALNPAVYEKLLFLRDAVSEKAHADAFKEVPKEYGILEDANRAPPLDQLRHIKQMTLSDGSKIILLTTDENKKYAVSSIKTPDIFQNFSKHFTVLQQVDVLKEGGYKPAKADTTDFPDVRDVKRAGWEDGMQYGVTGYELKSGEKISVTANDNPDLYAHIQGVNEFMKAPQAHQDRVEALRKDGYELVSNSSAPVQYWDIASIEVDNSSERANPSEPQLTDSRTGIIKITTKDGRKMVVAERLAPFYFEGMLQRKEGLSTVNSYLLQGYKWADAKTPPLSLTEKADIVPVNGGIDPVTGQPGTICYAVVVGDKKYLVSPEQLSKEDADILTEYNNLQKDGKPIPEDLAKKYQNINPLPLMKSIANNDAFQNLSEEKQEKLKNILESEDRKLLLPSDKVFTEDAMKDKKFHTNITDIDARDSKENGIIHFTYQDKKYTISRDFNPQDFAIVEGIEKNLSGLNKSLAEGYRRANDGDHNPTIVETSKQNEFGQGVMRFTTDTGEKIVVTSADDPYLFNMAMNHFKEKTNKDIDTVWEKYNLPDRNSFNINEVPTTIKDSDGKPKTLYSASISKVLSEYGALYASGSLKKDDPRYQLIRYLGHQNLLLDGMAIIPYIEDVKTSSWTVRKHAKDKNDQPKYMKLTSNDMAEMINGPKLENALQDLFAKEPISTDISKTVMETAAIHVDKTALVKKIDDQINDPNFINALTDLRLSGNEEAVGQATEGMFATIMTLMPEQAQTIQAKITASMTTNLVERQLQDPKSIPADVKDQARADVTSNTVDGIKQLFEVTDNITDPTLIALQKYLGSDANTKKMEKYLADFITYSEENPNLDATDASIAFVDSLVKQGSLNGEDETALKTMLIVLGNSNHTAKIVSMTNIAAALYQGFGGADKIGTTASERMATLETNIIPEMQNNFMLGEKTKKLIEPFMPDNGAGAQDSQNNPHQISEKQSDISVKDLKQQKMEKMMNHWGMNIAMGLQEIVFGLMMSQQNQNAVKASFAHEHGYRLSKAGDALMMAGGGVQAAYGMAQAGVKYSNSIIKKYIPSFAGLDKADGILNTPRSMVTNGMQTASSMLFGLGMMGMGIAGFMSKHQDPWTKSGSSFMTAGGAGVTYGGAKYAQSVYMGKVASQMGTASASLPSRILGINTMAQRLNANGVSAAATAGKAASFMRLGGMLGIGGIVVAGIGGALFAGQQIEQGLKNGDDVSVGLGAANAATSIAATVGMGVGMMVGGVVGGALMGAGALLFLPAMLLTMFIDDIRGDPTIKKINKQENATLDDIGSDGFLRDGAMDKFEFARYYMYHDGRSELNDDESFIETQQEMYDHFKETPGKHGSSENRLNWDLYNEEGSEPSKKDK